MRRKKATKKIGIGFWKGYYEAYYNAFGRLFDMQSRDEVAKQSFEMGWRYAYNLCELMSWRWFFFSFLSGVVTGFLALAGLIRGY